MPKKVKKQSKAKTQKAAQEKEQRARKIQEELSQHELPQEGLPQEGLPQEGLSQKNGDDDDSMDDQALQRPKLNDWTKKILECFIQQHGEEIKKEFHEKNPDFSKIESLFKTLNISITSANKAHKAPLESNNVRGDVYRKTHNAWSARVNQKSVKGNREEEWKAYYELHKMFRLFNKENHLPEEWNIPSDIPELFFGDRPPGIEELPDDEDSAFSSSGESESEESDSDEIDGIDALEAKMRKEYSSLSHGKVLYWWPVGMGTQIFVRYGSKKNPIYRVRAGSSLPYDPRSTEQVLSVTHGNAKERITEDGMVKEVWRYSRDDIQDITGVGWKVEDDDDTNANALALIRPAKNTIYPHTRVLVKWKLGGTTLERRGFIRRIANGSTLSGDRMIYVKAKELENAYWGYDVEEEQSDDESSESDGSLSDGSSSRHTHSHRSHRSGRYSARNRSTKLKEDLESDADSETSDSDHHQKPRRSKRLVRSKKAKSSGTKKDVDAEIDQLLKEIKRLKLIQRGKKEKSTASRKTRRH
ncbi:hypothetical protein BDV12DRAFT_204372 [Aspergillus spectabilis]